jgi:exodeoxyribonuclease VII small subunit
MSLTYRAAIEELETILRALETDAVDVDDLTARVERSAELIRLCRHKLRHAEASLDRVFDSLDDEELEEELEEEVDEDSDEPDEELDEDEDDDEDDDSRERPGGAGRPDQPSWLF